METQSNFGGGKRIRTADPLHAMQVLYQLSYTPERENALYRAFKKNASLFQKKNSAILHFNNFQVLKTGRSGQRHGIAFMSF